MDPGSSSTRPDFFQDTLKRVKRGSCFMDVEDEIFNLSVLYITKGPLSDSALELPDFYIVGSVQLGAREETVDLVRRFDRKEDRDTFEECLHRSSSAPFSMQPLRRLNINGAPCLAVSSTPVYTLQEMVPPGSYVLSASVMGPFELSASVKGNMFLKIATFFLGNNRVYPGKWDLKKLWRGAGKYKKLRLFDVKGHFTVDPEHLRSLGLLFEDFSAFKMHGDFDFYRKARQFLDVNNKALGEQKVKYNAMMQINSAEVGTREDL
ncbi:hypothetical protein GYMLUDRAFT_39820 [Collybiopsis luxurians FD-317 M1]|nr:hypothetical protein GYMLUDRAFT_39820 [Collybiopsis luxurians FD-317 M1]